MMEIRENHFSTEAEAVAEIEAAGYWPLTLEFRPETNGDHWHDFDSMSFVLEGEVRVTLADTGESCICGPGARILAKSGVVHREEHRGFKAVIGFSVDPATLTQPINKPPKAAGA